MLDIKIESFMAVVKQGSYTKAAAMLHVTQPAISQHIQKLEEYYGCTFFVSVGRHMKLTQYGELFLTYIKLQQANEHQFQKQLTNQLTPLKIGGTLSISEFYLPQLLDQLHQNSPLEISVANTEHLLQALISGSIDVAFIEGNFNHPLFNAYIFRKAPFIPVVSQNHPLAYQKVNLQDLFKYDLVIREKGSGTRAILEHYLADENQSLSSFSQLHMINNFSLIKQLLKSTTAISFMYEAVAKKEMDEGALATIHIKDYQVIHPLLFIYPKHSMNEKAIISFFNQCFKHSSKLI